MTTQKFSVICLPAINPLWSGWIRAEVTVANLSASRLPNILRSLLIMEMGESFEGEYAPYGA